ncbi:MAG: serine hydrolase domain-containing protein [Trebonia sp.]
MSGLLAATMTAMPGSAAAVRLDAGPAAARTPLQRALNKLVAMPSGPPGVIVIVQHGGWRAVYQAGTASLAQPRPLATTDHERLASVSKAFNGAVALSLVSRGKLRLSDTIGRWLPRLPRAWHRVTLREMLQHRSGLPDYTDSKALARQLQRAPHQIIPPGRLMRYVWHRPLQFPPGSRYKYDNSDNTVIALMTRAAAGRGYRALLRSLVYRPAGLGQTSLPAGSRLPHPYLHGYTLEPGHPAEDVSEALSASSLWAAGGMVSTPADTNQFIRAYLAPRFFSRHTQAAQLRFVPGNSSPPGPGTNAAGLGIFRYRTRCGTMYGHTGNFLGYTQLAAASRTGANSLSVTATEQLSLMRHPRVLEALRHAELLAVCTAMAPR